MAQVRTGLRGHEVPAEPSTYDKIPLPILEPGAEEIATLQGLRKKYRFRSRSTKFLILLESVKAHVVDGKLYDGSYNQVSFQPDPKNPVFGVFETDDEKTNTMLRAAKSFGSDFWDADQRERADQNREMERFTSLIESRPDLKRALLKRLKPDPDAKDFSSVLNPEAPGEPTFRA